MRWISSSPSARVSKKYDVPLYKDKAGRYILHRVLKVRENDYIICHSSQKKKYNTLLTLTNKGVEIAQKVSNKIDSILDLAGGELDSEKRNIMYECLNIINNNLEKICKNYEGEN